MGTVRNRYYRNPHRARGLFGLVPVALFIAVLAGIGLVVVILGATLVALGPFLLPAVATLVVARHLYRRQRRAAGRRRQPPMPSARSARSTGPPAPDWRATRHRFTQLRSEYAQFECDPLAVLRLPALTDVTVASTSRFVDAFAEAQALDSDTEPPAEHRTRYASAVDQAWRAWHAARDAAERIQLSGIPPREHATVQRAIKLLIMARDSDHDAERRAAYAKARTELAKLDRSGALRLPPAAAAALDTAARAQLPAANRQAEVRGSSA